MATTTINAPLITPSCKPVYYKGKQSIDSKTYIEITCDSPHAMIYFSVNGRTPDPFETWNVNTVTMRYTKPFVLKGSDKPRIVKAVAICEKLKQKSAVVTKSFNVAVHPASAKQRKRMSIIEMNDDVAFSDTVVYPTEESPTENDTMPTDEDKHKEQDEFNFGEPVMTEEKISGNVLSCPEEQLCKFDDMNEKPDLPADCNDTIVQQEEEMNDINDANEQDKKHFKCEGNHVTDDLPELEIKEQSILQVTNEAEMFSNDLTPVDVDYPQDQTINTSEEPKSYEIEKETNLNLNQIVTPQLSVVIQQADKDIQATAEMDLKAPQTDPEIDQPKKVLSSRNPPLQRVQQVQMVSKRVGNEFKEESKECQTVEMEKPQCREQECQTEGYQQRKGISGCINKGSPGRGYWRQQIDHITHQLKTEAYNNPNFQEIISQPSLAQINHVNVHEGLDELILVINIAIQRHAIATTKK